MVIYMSGSTPYNDVEVMCSEQSAGSICMEGAVRTEAPASDAEAVAADAFLEYLQTNDAMKVFEEYGFAAYKADDKKEGTAEEAK